MRTFELENAPHFLSNRRGCNNVQFEEVSFFKQSQTKDIKISDLSQYNLIDTSFSTQNTITCLFSCSEPWIKKKKEQFARVVFIV
jgi:hypothetical protein